MFRRLLPGAAAKPATNNRNRRPNNRRRPNDKPNNKPAANNRKPNNQRTLAPPPTPSPSVVVPTAAAATVPATASPSPNVLNTVPTVVPSPLANQLINATPSISSLNVTNAPTARRILGLVMGNAYDALDQLYGGNGALARKVYDILREHTDAIVDHVTKNPRDAMTRNPVVSFLTWPVRATAKQLFLHSRGLINRTLGAMTKLPVDKLLTWIVNFIQGFALKNVPIHRIRRVVAAHSVELQGFIRQQSTLKPVVLGVIANELTDAEVVRIVTQLRKIIVLHSSRFLFGGLFKIPPEKWPQSLL